MIFDARATFTPRTIFMPRHSAKEDSSDLLLKNLLQNGGLQLFIYFRFSLEQACDLTRYLDKFWVIQCINLRMRTWTTHLNDFRVASRTFLLDRASVDVVIPMAENNRAYDY